MIYLIDYENVGEKGIEKVENINKEDIVVLFFNNSSKITLKTIKDLNDTECRIELYSLGQKGKNALDFELVSYLGYLIKENPKDNLIIISKDKGYNFAIDFWNNEKKIENKIQIQESISNINSEINKTDLEKAIDEKKINFNINTDELLCIINKYKTKQGINNAIMKIYGSEKTGIINSAIKKLIKDKKGR